MKEFWIRIEIDRNRLEKLLEEYKCFRYSYVVLTLVNSNIFHKSTAITIIAILDPDPVFRSRGPGQGVIVFNNLHLV